MSKNTIIKAFVYRKVNELLAIGNGSVANARFANLRRGVGKEPSELPSLWGEFLVDEPEEFENIDGKISNEEWAVYTALTLFALHQQGHSISQPMHVEGVSIGNACKRFVVTQADKNAQERIIKKLKQVTDAHTKSECTYHFRNLISLFKSESIPLDYAMVASDLYSIISNQNTSRVYTTWAKDFYTKKSKKEN